MKCKWYAEFEGVCTNDACPYCSDTCRVDEHPEVCRFAEEDLIFSAEELVQALRCCANGGSDCKGCPLTEPSVKLKIEESLHTRCYRIAENQAADMLEKLAKEVKLTGN